MTNDSEQLDREATRLYWHSDLTVKEIADRLDISTSTLYRHLAPLSAGARCHACGGEIAFASRSARDAGESECVECGVAGAAAPDPEGEQEEGAAEDGAAEDGAAETGTPSRSAGVAASRPTAPEPGGAPAAVPFDTAAAAARQDLVSLAGMAAVALTGLLVVTLLRRRS